MKLLSPTDDEWALKGREKCWETIHRKKTVPSLSQLPVGTVIEFDYNGKVVQLKKSAPAYQFKRPFWWNGVNYWPKTRIPENFRVIET